MDMDTITTDTTPQFGEQSTKEKIFKILNLSVPILMGIFIFFNPFPHTTAIKEICYYSSLLIVLVLVCFKKIEFSFQSPLAIPIALFTLWASFSILWALNVQNTLHDVHAHLIKHVVIFFILINFFNSKKLLIALSWIIIISASILSAGGLFYYYIILDNPLTKRYALGLFNELPINFIGVITVFAIILCLNSLFEVVKSYHKTALILCLVPLFASTLLTQTRGTFVALVCSVALQLYYKSKKSSVFFFLGIMVFAAFIPIGNRLDLGSLKQRFFINNVTYQIIKDYPLKGIGFGMETFINNIDKTPYIRKIQSKFGRQHIYSTHNLLLSIIVRLGIVGLSLFLYIIFIISKMCWQTIKYGNNNFIRKWGQSIAVSFVAYFIIAFFEPVFLFFTSTAVFYIISAMLVILWHLNKEVYPQSVAVQG